MVPKYLILTLVVVSFFALVLPVSAAAPVSSFTANNSGGMTPITVMFNDTSTNIPTSWSWSFNNVTGNTTEVVFSTDQNVTYIFDIGNWSILLNATNADGSNVSTQTTLINVSVYRETVNYTNINLGGNPELVQFHVQTVWGVPLAGATVTIQGIETTTGVWAWIQTLIGIAIDETPIHNTLMTGTTDSQGNTEFMMVPTVRYNVSTTYAGYTFSPYYMYPHDREYTVVANPLASESWTSSTVNITGSKNVTVQRIYYTDALQGIRVIFNSTSGTTTGGFINISQNATTNWSFAVTGNMTVNQNLTIPIGGSSAKVSVIINSSTGNVTKQYPVSFEGPAVSIPVFDTTIVFWGSLFLIVLTGMFATASTSPQVSVMVCVEAWIFLALGWLRPLEDIVGTNKLATVFTFATVFCILWIIREAKKKETGK